MVSSLVARLFAASWLAALTLLLLEGLWLFATGVAPAQLLDLAAAAAAPLIPCAGFGMGAWLLAHLPRRFLPLLPGHRALDLILLAGAVASFLALMLFGPQLRGYHHLIVLLPWGFGWMALHQRKPRRWASAAALLTALAALAAGLLLGAGGRLHDAMDRSVVVSGFARLSARIVDLDRDGRSPLQGRSECDDLAATIGRGSVEIVGNGRDDNCIGGDLTAAPKGLDKPLFSSGFGLPRTPPIIVISVDSLRNDHVGRRVAGASLTPNMDRLLARSVTFTRAYAHAPYTSASMSAMWTSSPMLSMVRGKRWLGFEASLVELLSLAGYRTVAVTDMPATWCVFLGFSEVDMTSPPQDAKKLTDRALDHASRADRHTPLMLWVHYFDPHAPYRAHEKYEKLGGDVRGRYAQEVAYTDHHLGRLIGGLSREGLLEQSLVIFLSDHGESLGEGGRVMHGWSLAEEAVRVPLAFQGPNLQAREVTSPVSLLDLAPTVIDLLGGAAPPLWRGRSLIGALQGAPLAPRPVHLQADYHGEQGPSLAVIQWPWKYSEAAPFGLPRVELLAGGEGAPNSSAAPVEQLRRLLGRHTDLSLNDRLIARRKRTLRAIRPGCAWKEKVGADPSANRSMAAGFKGGRITPCGESGTLGP